MDSWKTSTKRYTPSWKTHPVGWRMRMFDTMITVCPECDHDLNMHFYERDYPELCFCQVDDCQCTCDWFRTSSYEV